MKIYNKIVLDKDNNIIEEDHFEYNGPITYCGGGGGSSSDSAGDTGHPTMTGDSNQTNWSETDDYESDFSDVQSSAPDTYSAPSSDSYSGMDNEQQAEHDRQHYQSWKQETQYPQYDGTEDNEEQAEIDRKFAIDKGLITVDSQGNVSDGPNVRNSEGVIVDRNDPSVQQQDLTWKEHWANRPDAIKWSPTLSFLYATGKNIGEWTAKKGWGNTGAKTNDMTTQEMSGDNESQMMKDVAPYAPYIVSGTTKPTNSPAANWYQGLGGSSTNPNAFNLATEFAAAKSKQSVILGNPSAVGMLASNQTPYFDFLQKHSLTKGIL